MLNALRSSAYLLKSNWHKNYRHRGGISAAARCLLGEARLTLTPPGEQRSESPLECLTFSVVPPLTAVWARAVAGAFPVEQMQILIGDCSGGYRDVSATATVYPLLNRSHGSKLDVFMRHVCRAEYVLISDDDIFWLSAESWRWAQAQFAADERVAVVSFVPRGRFTWELDGVTHQPMGSYGLIVRRSLWLREGLSFMPVAEPSPNPQSYRGQYDTADYANVELIKRGYRVLVAPAEQRSKLLITKGVSRFILQLQTDPSQIEGLDDRPDLVWMMCQWLRTLDGFIAEHLPEADRAYRVGMVAPELLDHVESVVLPRLSAAQRAEVEERVAQKKEQMFTLRPPNHDIKRV